jgi:hypothetical protein
VESECHQVRWIVLLHILEVPGSHVFMENGYSDGVSWFSSTFQENANIGSVREIGQIASFHVLNNYSQNRQS